MGGIMKFQTINPATEGVIKEFETMSQKEVMKIADSAQEAYLSWKVISLKERASYMKKLSDTLRKNKEKYGKIMTREMGKPITNSIAEIEKCAWTSEVYAKNSEEWSKGDEVQADGIEHKVIFQPLGVILAIMPWNFPFWQAFRFIIPTLLAGNTAILKHASNVTESALAIEESIKEAGFPENVFRTIIADHETVGKLIESDIIRGVSLTGSTSAGKRIGEVAGKNLKKVVLELGGSDPFIVLEDADIEFAAKGAVSGRFQNNGQSCIASKRFIVMENIAEEFAKKFTEETKKLKVGDPTKKDTDLGPLVNKEALEKIEAQVKNAVEKGGKILTGGKRIGAKGYFFEPTVISNTSKDMEITSDETFGPIAAIITVKDEEEAVKVANLLEFGLGGSVWTKDLDKGKEVAKKIESGTVFVNSITKSDPRMPFGGVKESGLGRELSKYGMREFVNVKGLNVYEHKDTGIKVQSE